jgi:hypothetical protein
MIKDGDMPGVRALIQRLSAEVKQLVRGAIEIAYFSRGAISYNEVLQMSAAERDLAIEFIQERLEAAKKMQFPVF